MIFASPFEFSERFEIKRRNGHGVLGYTFYGLRGPIQRRLIVFGASDLVNQDHS